MTVTKTTSATPGQVGVINVDLRGGRDEMQSALYAMRADPGFMRVVQIRDDDGAVSATVLMRGEHRPPASRSTSVDHPERGDMQPRRRELQPWMAVVGVGGGVTVIGGALIATILRVALDHIALAVSGAVVVAFWAVKLAKATSGASR